ncbi:MAG: hypothetical protein U1F33_10435 [Alphaproteobacteria bacterium]
MRSRRRRERRSASNLLPVLLSLALGLGVIEIGLRAARVSFPIFAAADATLGWTLRPDLAGLSIHEGTAFVRTNAQGFRASRDWTTVKDARVYRVAVLGDSYVESSNLPEADSLPERIGTEGPAPLP